MSLHLLLVDGQFGPDSYGKERVGTSISSGQDVGISLEGTTKDSVKSDSRVAAVCFNLFCFPTTDK